MGVRQSLTRVVQRISHVAITPTARGLWENHIIAHSWVAIRAAYQPFLTVSEGFLAITQCSACFKRERHAYLRRTLLPRGASGAPTLNVPSSYRTATLTIVEGTPDHHDWRCAYCQKPFAVLEHVQPLKHGGEQRLLTAFRPVGSATVSRPTRADRDSRSATRSPCYGGATGNGERCPLS
jgi:hypothetical protein